MTTSDELPIGQQLLYTKSITITFFIFKWINKNLLVMVILSWSLINSFEDKIDIGMIKCNRNIWPEHQYGSSLIHGDLVFELSWQVYIMLLTNEL